jgi:DnaJ-class molecular chaperone
MIGPGIMAQSTGVCTACSGEGSRILKPCHDCHGKKFIEREKVLHVKITPGMQDGQNIVFGGECSESAEFETPGDVILTIRRTDPETGWRTCGSDLYFQHTISYAEAMMGVSFRLKDHPSGKSPLFVWNKGPLLQGAVLRAKGWGMPSNGSTEAMYGDAFIEFQVTPPEQRPWRPEELLMLQTVFHYTPPADPTDVEIIHLQ